MHNLQSDISSFLKHKLADRTAGGDPTKLAAELQKFLELERNARRPHEETAAVSHLRPAGRNHLRVVS